MKRPLLLLLLMLVASSALAQPKVTRIPFRMGAISDTLRYTTQLTTQAFSIRNASEVSFQIQSTTGTCSTFVIEVSNDSIGWRALNQTYTIAGSNDTLVTVMGPPVGVKVDSTKAVSYTLLPNLNVGPSIVIPYNWARAKIRPRYVHAIDGDCSNGGCDSQASGHANGFSRFKFIALVRRVFPEAQ